MYIPGILTQHQSETVAIMQDSMYKTVYPQETSCLTSDYDNSGHFNFGDPMLPYKNWETLDSATNYNVLFRDVWHTPKIVPII